MAFLGQQYFVAVGAYSELIDVRRVTLTSDAQAITVLHMQFTTHGLCDVIVSDNGPTFT